MRPGEPSETAKRVAAHRLLMARAPAPYGRPDDDDRLQADVAAGLDVAVSGMRRYLDARTRFVDAVVVGAIDDGIDQIVLAGAGYDGRSFRYAKPGVRWFELDHPDTQADKRERLARLGVDLSGVTFSAVDFVSGDVAGTLAQIGHDGDRPTLFICEGVAGYLPHDAFVGLMAAMARRAAPTSRLAVTLRIQPETPEAALRSAALRSAVASLGEELVTQLPRADVAPLLLSVGWRVANGLARSRPAIGDSQAEVGGGDDAEPASRAARAGFVVAVVTR